jgi:hypothetical protein
MKINSIVLSLIFFFASCFSAVFASEVTNGYIRLILNESSGRYSIYFLSNPNSVRYEPLFSGEDPATSYASVLMNGKVYRLGGKYFKTNYEKQNRFPVFVFEGDNIKVTQSFSPIKTANSKYINGVIVTYKIQNTGSEELPVGLRILIDTDLEEKAKNNTFITSGQIIKNETLIDGRTGERFWLSRGKNTALMGSIINPVNTSEKAPDYVHFANWKRLNDAAWKMKYVKKRSFTNSPFSIDDSAVCYYFDPQLLSPGSDFTYSIVLSTEDVDWYNSLTVPVPEPASSPDMAAAAKTQVKAAPAIAVPAPSPVPVPPAPALETPADNEQIMAATINVKQIELDAYVEAVNLGEDVSAYTLKKYQSILNQFIAGEIVLNEQDITDLEKAIEWYR